MKPCDLVARVIPSSERALERVVRSAIEDDKTDDLDLARRCFPHSPDGNRCRLLNGIAEGAREMAGNVIDFAPSSSATRSAFL